MLLKQIITKLSSSLYASRKSRFTLTVGILVAGVTVIWLTALPGDSGITDVTDPVDTAGKKIIAPINDTAGKKIAVSVSDTASKKIVVPINKCNENNFAEPRRITISEKPLAFRNRPLTPEELIRANAAEDSNDIAPETIISNLENGTKVNYEGQVGATYLITVCINGEAVQGYIAYRVSGISPLEK